MSTKRQTQNHKPNPQAQSPAPAPIPAQWEVQGQGESGPVVGGGGFDDSAHPGDEGLGGGVDGVEGAGEGQPTQPPAAYQNSPQPTAHNHLPPWPANGGPTTFHGWVHAATDTKGHEAKIPLRVQPAIARQIGLVVGSKRFPYRTPQELVRHAVYEHLRWLETIDGTIPSVMGVVDSINALLLDEVMLQEQADILARHLTAVEQHLQMGAYESAHRTVTVALALLDKLPAGEWRDSYRSKFLAMYSYQPDGAGAVNGAPKQLPPAGNTSRTVRGRRHQPNTNAHDEGGTDDAE